MIIKFKIFEDVRLEDIFKSDSEYLNSLKRDNFDDTNNFIKYFSIRIDKDKIIFVLKYNHSENHNLKNRINQRTNLKNIDEFNILFKKSLEELFRNNYETIKTSSSYSLYLKEYNFSIILNISYIKSEIYIRTIKTGLESMNVKNVVQINSTL